MKARLINTDFIHASGICVTRKKVIRTCDLHGHNFFELDIITGGNAPTVLNGAPMEATPGTVFFLTPEDFHEYPTGAPLSILNIQFTGGAVGEAILYALTASRRRAFSLPQTDMEIISDLFSLMEKLLSEKENTEKQLSRLLEVLLLSLKAERAEEGATTSSGHDMQRAVSYIHEHFKENPSLGEVAAMLSLNKQYFCGKFKEYTKKSYKEYVRERKLSYAKRLLRSSDLSVTEIALECGYATQSHFNREFKAYFGIAPLTMRQNAK